MSKFSTDSVKNKFQTSVKKVGDIGVGSATLNNLKGAGVGLGTRLLLDANAYGPTTGPTIDDIRAISWSNQLLWDFMFLSGDNYEPPSRFTDWYPAVEIEDNLANIENYTVQGTISTFEIPKATKARTFKLTFIDDVRGTLVDWYRLWYNDIVGNGSYVLTLQEAARTIMYQKLDTKLSPIQTYVYNIIPAGPLTYIGSSTSETCTYSIDFTIVGSLEVNSPQDPSDPVKKWKIPGTNYNPFF